MAELDDGLTRLADLVAEATRTRKRWGYFAALRYRVARRVKAAATDGLFENSELAVQLERGLLKRYFRVIEAHRMGGMMPQSWEIALSATEQSQWAILQHLLLAMSAHLYLDLGVCAAELMRGRDYATLDRDFATLNDLLFNELERARLMRACPVVTWPNRGMGQADIWLARRGRALLDESTWNFGRKLSEMDPAYWAATISSRDSTLSELSWQVLSPGFPSNWLLWCGRRLEGEGIEKGIANLG
jgi:hypothetical protein